MKIALVSSFVPFINGGARNIVEWLQVMLEKEGHHVERVYLPEIDAPDLLFRQMMAYRWWIWRRRTASSASAHRRI